MTSLPDLRAEPIATARLRLEPLRLDHAAEMVSVLADPALYTVIGGEPPADEAALREEYGYLVAGSGRPGELWLNWIMRQHAGGAAIGTVQSTVEPDVGWVAWIVGTPWQGRGFASEAATAVVAWLRAAGVTTVAAAVHPDHEASARVAARAGLTVTDDLIDGERVWRG